MKKSWKNLLEKKKILIADGGWGTELFKHGLSPGDAPEVWNIDHPDGVRAVAVSYVRAGADIILTNTFGGNALKLGKVGLGLKTAEINRLGAEISKEAAAGKGALVFLKVESENSIAGFDALGAIGKSAEEVADEACQSFLTYAKEQAALDPHLADQIVPYLALARGDSVFTTSSITRHLLTNIWVVKQFLDADVQVTGKEGEAGQITISV